MANKNGIYQTENGSTVKIFGEHSGKVRIDFDWLEENRACGDCEPILKPNCDHLMWSCDYCGGGNTKLTKIK